MQIPKEIGRILGALKAEDAVFKGNEIRVLSAYSWEWSASWRTEDNPGEEVKISPVSLPILAKARADLQLGVRGAQGGAHVVVRAGRGSWDLASGGCGIDYKPPTAEGGQGYGVEPLVLLQAIRANIKTAGAPKNKNRVLFLEGGEVLATDGCVATRAQSGIFRRGFIGAHEARIDVSAAKIWATMISALAKTKIGGSWELQATDKATDLVFRGLGGELRVSARNWDEKEFVSLPTIRRILAEDGEHVQVEGEHLAILRYFERVAIWRTGEVFAWNSPVDVFCSSSGCIPSELPVWCGTVSLLLKAIGKIPKGNVSLSACGDPIMTLEIKPDEKKGIKGSPAEKICYATRVKVGGNIVQGGRFSPPLDPDLDVGSNGITLWRETA